MNHSRTSLYLRIALTLCVVLIALAAPHSDEWFAAAHKRLAPTEPVNSAQLTQAELQKAAQITDPNGEIAAAPAITADQSDPARIAAKEIFIRNQRGEEISASEKALLEQYELGENFEPSSGRRDPLDDNGGVTFTYSGASLRIPPGTGSGGTGDDSTRAVINVVGLGSILDVEVQIDSLRHTFDGDLDIYLVSPAGTRRELCTDNGGTGEHFFLTRFDDDAATLITAGTSPFTNTYRPELTLSVFDGQGANGDWTLLIDDDAGGDTGRVFSWSIQILAAALTDPHQYATAGILSPGAGPYAPNAVLPVTARFQNFGLTAEAADVFYSFNGGPTETGITDVLPQNGVDTVTFANSIALPAVDGSYTLTVWCTVAGDAIPGNDTNRVNVVVRGGDDCAAAIVLTGSSGAGTWNNCAFTDNTPGQSCGSSDNDLVYTLVAAPGAYVSIWQPSNLIDSRHSLRWSGACPGDSLVGCIDDPDNTQFFWTNNTGVAQNVYFVIGGWTLGTTCGDFTINWFNTVDSCAAPAINVPANAQVGSVTLTATVSGGFGGTPTLQWYTGVNCVAGNEIAGANSTTYVTNVDGIFSCRAFILDSVNCAACDSAVATILPTPPGETCEEAIVISYPLTDDSVTVSGTTSGAVADCIDSCNSTIARSAGPDHFAVITLTSCRRLEFNLDNGTQGSGDMYITVYDGGAAGCCTLPILCNDDVSAFPIIPWSVHRHSTGLNSYVAGELAAGTYYIRMAYYATGSGTYRLRIYDSGPCACELTCGGSDEVEVTEDRFDRTFSYTDPNGGCNDSTPVFSTVSCGQTICGVLFNYLNPATTGFRAYYRDTDWFVLDDPSDGLVDLTLTSAIPVYFSLVDSNTCPPTILISDSADACSTRVISGPLTAGQYTGVITPKLFAGNPTPAQYRFTVACANSCIPDTATNVTAALANVDADPTANDIRLRWTTDPEFVGTYDVYTNPVDEAFPGAWVRIGTGILPTLPATIFVHDDGATIQRRYYVIIGVCP
jgi:subtilisin-like proprotein convertase family protein